jgi:hypothetical protein
MQWIAEHPEIFAGKTVGTGQCVALVEYACPGMPHTAQWKAGPLVKGSALKSGTAIASFDPDGTYGNHTDGRSHAAIYVSQDPEGLLVWDQWAGQVTHQRVIRFKDPGDGLNANNGNAFSVIETTTVIP